MSKPSDARAPLRGVMVVMLMAPVLAWPIVSTTEGEPPVESVVTAAISLPAASAPVGRSASAVSVKPAGGYQIRCWQHGRLLFEENHVALPDMARYGLRIGGTDTHGRPLYVADTQHATCLIRPAADDRSWPR